MDVCPPVPPGAGFISSMTGYINCQARILGSGGWTALAAPGSTLSAVLTGFLTIAVALAGYNLLLGRTLTVREGTLAFVKIGAVFALATNWPAYRTLVYDLVTDGPAQVVAEIGPRGGIVGSDGTLLQRLDVADQLLNELAILGVANPAPNASADVPPAPFQGFDALVLGGSKTLFELTAVAGLAAVRIVAGLMLALGPFFIGFLMFDVTRSLFEGWVRVLSSAALASVGVSIALGLELALLGPWISDVVARRTAGEPLPTVASELFVMISLFSIVVLASLVASAQLARAFRLPTQLRLLSVVPEHQATTRDAATAVNGIWPDPIQRSRAAAVADILMSTTRRERGERENPRAGLVVIASQMPTLSRAEEASYPVLPVGRSFTRRLSPRVSASAARRDSNT